MINLNIVGDFYLNNDNVNNLDIDNDLQLFFKNSDLNILNLEAPIVDKITPKDKYGPSLYMNDDSISVLKELNTHLVTLANNHIMDQGEKGLKNTIDTLNLNDIKFIGAGANLTKANAPYIKQINGITLGIINVAENEFSNTYGDYYGAAPLDIIDNTSLIQELKANVDKLIVIVHGGAEMHKYPSPRFKKTLRFFADQGADAVIAHHTHKFNGYEIYNDVPIVYGTGNFIFPNKNGDDLWNIGVIANLCIEKEKIDLKIYPVKLSYKQKITLSFLSDSDTISFIELEKDRNEVIANDKLLEKEYDLFVASIKNQYLHYLQPYTSKYLHKLFSMGIIPNFLKNNKKRLLYLNLVRCEAHRDVLIKILNDKL